MMRTFRKDQQGTVLVLFALSLPLLLGLIAWAVDFSQTISSRNALQAATDAAAQAVLAELQTASQATVTPDAVFNTMNKQDMANSVVFASLSNQSGFTTPAVTVTTTNTTITVAASSSLATFVLSALGAGGYPVSAETTVYWSQSNQLQMSLAIDASGALIPAATQRVLKSALTSIVAAYSIDPSLPNIYLSVVPYNSQIATDIVMADAQESVVPKDAYAAASHQAEEALAALSSAFISPAFAEEEAEPTPPPGEAFDVAAISPTLKCYDDASTAIPRSLGDLPSFGSNGARLAVPCENSKHLAMMSVPHLPKFKSASDLSSSAFLNSPVIKAINSIVPGGCRNATMGLLGAFEQLPKDNNPKVIVLISAGHNSRNRKIATDECAVDGKSATDRSAPTSDDNTRAIGNEAILNERTAATCRLLTDPATNGGLNVKVVTVRLFSGRIRLLSSCASPVAANQKAFLNVASPSSIAPSFAGLAPIIAATIPPQMSSSQSASNPSTRSSPTAKITSPATPNTQQPALSRQDSSGAETDNE